MSTPDSFPWVPVGPSDEYNPLDDHDSHPSEETPMVVVPRGGTRSIGRSCYQVETRHSTFLVDCGLNQSAGGQFPDFRGLEPGQIDAVFLTHAHIDHCGGLPVLEARGLLDGDAPIFATPPTTQLAHTLLEDSLKIHTREAQNDSNTPQQFTKADVNAIYDRFKPVPYGTQRIEDHEHITTEETATVEFGDAAHLLGSAWVAIQSDGYRVVFSGDLGGRAKHLNSIETPPNADALFLESTYGNVHTHVSMDDARKSLYQQIADDVRERRPVLIPTFAVGRAQTILLKLSERFRVDDDIRSQSQVVVDGMAQDATRLYHTHVTDSTYYSNTIVNPAENSGMTTPFSPATTHEPERDTDRESLLDTFEQGGEVPIVVVPSGMLTGGHSPRYLTEFRARFDEASIYLTGYQANGTPGRALRNAKETGADDVSLTLSTDPFGHDWPASDHVSWTQTADRDERVRVSLPTDWVKTIDGLSGHASQQFLLYFARDVSPDTVGLIHGPAYAQTDFASHLAENLESANAVTRTRMLTPIPITRDPEILTPTKSYDDSSEKQDMKTQLESISNEVSMLADELASHREPLSEEDIRNIVADELQSRE